MKKNKTTIDLPSSYIRDLKFFLKFKPPDFKFKYNFDYFAYLGNKIIQLKSYKKFSYLKKVPLSSVILRLELGKHYKRYIEYLIQHKFIETDNYYKVKNEEHEGKCKCYSFTKKYSIMKHTKYEITNRYLLNKFYAWKEKKKKEVFNDETLTHLHSMMKKVSIDTDGVKKYLDTSVNNKETTKNKANLELSKCERINHPDKDENLFISKDSYGRIHSNFTNISKNIREDFLSLDGEKLVHIDIISCQPALLHTTFRDYLMKIANIVEQYEVDEYYSSPLEKDWGGKDVRDKYVSKLNYYTGEHIYGNDFQPTIKKHGFTSYHDLLEDATKELEYYETVLSHDIYQFFSDRWEYYFGGDKSRDESKTEWITYVFGKVDAKGHEKFETIWKAEFPTLNKILKHFKNGGHKPLSHELQRKESDLMYGDVCPKINELNIDYITVHDCIVVKESDVDVVYDIFDEILEENGIMTGVNY